QGEPCRSQRLRLGERQRAPGSHDVERHPEAHGEGDSRDHQQAEQYQRQDRPATEPHGPNSTSGRPGSSMTTSLEVSPARKRTTTALATAPVVAAPCSSRTPACTRPTTASDST